jgi:hypothetical protein
MPTDQTSPYGRRITAEDRKKLESLSPETNAKYLGQFIKEHPAQTAVGLLSAPIIPEGLAGMGIGALLGGIGRSVDKLHPLTTEESDYKTRSALSNTADIGGNALGSALMQGIVGKLLGNVTKAVAPVIKIEAQTAKTG